MSFKVYPDIATSMLPAISKGFIILSVEISKWLLFRCGLKLNNFIGEKPRFGEMSPNPRMCHTIGHSSRHRASLFALSDDDFEEL